MKKLIFILLITISIIIASNIVSAEVKFGSWNKWDEELPPAESKNWWWGHPGNEPRVLTIRGTEDFEGNDIVLFFSDVLFSNKKKAIKRAVLVFYSSGNKVKKEDWDIPDADFALAAFPPYRGMLKIRAYRREDTVFKFFEEWDILFKDRQMVVSKDAKFRQLFKRWLEEQFTSEEILDLENLTDSLLPEIIIYNKKTFAMRERIVYKKSK